MKYVRSLVYSFFLFLISCHSSKQVASIDNTTIDNLRSHVEYLADDKLEGRRTGSNGERLAMEYISEKFKNYGLEAKGEDGYYQSFEVYDGKQIGEGTQLSINGKALVPGKEFFPFAFSANLKMEALPSMAVQEADMPWFFDLKDVMEDNKGNPHFDLLDYIRINSKKAKDRGASAILLYNSSGVIDKLSFDPKDRSAVQGIPIIYISKEAAATYLKDSTSTIELKFNIAIQEKRRTGHNVIGFLDNGAPSTIILGAHFDHLGHGEDGGSLNTSKEALIHNGADDNASGTAALIEIARKLKQSKAKNHNYLFIAFSGEELGLYGSKYFAEHPTIDLRNADFMINMDMVGRLNDSSRVVTIGGIGTSPSWPTVIRSNYFENAAAAKKNQPSLVIRTDSSGTGPSDHTSFYRKDIPVLFYFTGQHMDYHKPTDDANKINYAGEQTVISHILYVIESLDLQPKLVFTKTRETQTTSSRSFTVSMGIMPDYTYAGTGVRADGISEGKPAQKAGLKPGDIILQLGDHSVTSMESYMQVLGKFVKGEKTKVKFKRGDKVMEATVEF